MSQAKVKIQVGPNHYRYVAADSPEAREHARKADTAEKLRTARDRWAMPCAHLGESLGPVRCGTCGKQHATTPAYGCALHGRCTRDTAAHDRSYKFCRQCDDYHNGGRWSLPDDPACGVVVGCWRWPSVAELQVRTIRHHCGDVPILLCVDPDDPERDRRFLDLSREDNVYVDLHPTRLGHTAGDLRAFRDGLLWARRLGLDYLCKLSHRFVWDSPRWLQRQAWALRPTGLPAGGAECLQNGKARWPIRTECLLLDVGQWDAAAVRPAGDAAENVIWRRLQKTGPGNYLPWKELGAERNQKRAGYLWHGPNTLAEYWALAQRHGVVLDADFATAASGHLPGYKL